MSSTTSSREVWNNEIEPNVSTQCILRPAAGGLAAGIFLFDGRGAAG
jgi:hypothetical protein